MLESGSFVFIRPNDVYTYTAFNHFDFEMFSITFSEQELLHTLNYLNIPLSNIISPSLPIHYVIHGNTKTFLEQHLEFMIVKNQKENLQKLFRVFLPVALYLLHNLNRMFKRYFKITPTEYINSKRLGYAAELLVEQKYSTTEICFMAGFNNLSHFYSVFRKQFQCTPNQFIKKK